MASGLVVIWGRPSSVGMVGGDVFRTILDGVGINDVVGGAFFQLLCFGGFPL